jgi:hypothetical protein
MLNLDLFVAIWAAEKGDARKQLLEGGSLDGGRDDAASGMTSEE